MNHIAPCLLLTGYYGTNCTDACALKPCEHESTCSRKLSSPRGYTCDCPRNFFGHYCEKKYRTTAGSNYCLVCRHWLPLCVCVCVFPGLTFRAPEVGGVTRRAAPATVGPRRASTLTATRPTASVAARWGQRSPDEWANQLSRFWTETMDGQTECLRRENLSCWRKKLW